MGEIAKFSPFTHPNAYTSLCPMSCNSILVQSGTLKEFFNEIKIYIQLVQCPTSLGQVGLEEFIP